MATPAGLSDEWVTAYVGCALAPLQVPGAPLLAEQAWHVLRNRRTDGGWGFNAGVPADADSTAFALQLADQLSRLGSATAEDRRRAESARAFLECHVDDDGSAHTFGDEAAIRAFTGVPAAVSFDGWTGPHPCVTSSVANVHSLPSADRLRSRLIELQHADGSWGAYWWPDRSYSTAFAVRALSADGTNAARAAVGRAGQWALGRIDAASRRGHGHVFDLALHCVVLQLQRPGMVDEPAVAACAARLCELQQADGSWASSAVMRIPPPMVVDPDLPALTANQPMIVRDAYRTLTTATVLTALSAGNRSGRD